MSYLSFKVIAETRYLQTVRITGNHPVLGEWDPQKSYPLTTTVSAYPEWTHESRIQIDPSHLLEFKCLIQDGEEFIWESVPNRVHRCDYRRNFVIVRFNGEMNVRTFQKYELSHEFDQEELLQAQRHRYREYQPFETDSSDNESLPELVKQLTGSISIRQLDTDWRETIKAHFECKLKQKSISKFRKISEHYGSPEIVFEYKRKRSSQQIFNDSYVVCLSLKIPIKITQIENIPIYNKKDISQKYRFELTQDPYLLSMYDLFSNRLSLKAIWIGWMGVSNIDATEFQFLQQYVYEQYKCFGIELDYEKLAIFSQYMEPIFNNLTPKFYSEEDYLYINKVFAQYVNDAMFCTLFNNQFQHLHSLFIFDYHLFLVPLYIKEGLIKKNELRPRICTIIRRTFPSPKQFRILQCSQMILSSLLMSDLISVVQLKCLHYFVQCLPFQFQKMTQIQGMSAFTIEVLGRKIILDYGSVGLNIKQFTFNENKSNIQYMVGVDSISIYSGLKLKFNIVDQLPQNIQLIQILYYNNEDDYEKNDSIQILKNEIYDLADQINKKHDYQKIKLVMDRNDLIQYYGMADIFIKTSLRESTSTTYLEYIHVRQSLNKTAKLILSQWCHFKVEHIKINPNDTQQSANQIVQALNDKKPIHINVPNSNDWLLRLNDHLSYCEDYWLDKQLYDSAKELTIGLKDRQFSQIETSKIISKFQSNLFQDNQKLIILAYTEQFKQKIQKVDQLIQALEQLSLDDNNTLILISDQECELMELTFGSIRNLYIIGQDGLFIKQNNQTSFQQIVDRDHYVEAKLIQIANQGNFILSENNLTYTLTFKEKLQDTNTAATILIQNLMKELRNELDDYIIIQQGYQLKVKHQYLQIEELIKIIINQEVNQKGLISLANIISFDRELLERIIQIFQYIGMPLNKKFHCISISDQIGKNSNVVLENTQEIILLLNKYANTK